MTDRTSNYANAFKTTLSSDMASTDLIANVVSTAGAPATPCYLAIDANDATKREYIFFDGSQTGTSLATSALGNRYLAGSAAGSGIVHSAGAEVTQVPSAQSFADLHDRIDADETVNAAHRTHATPVTAHSALTGLTADDHSAVYLNTARHDLTARHGSAVVDHGLAGGLGDDDHPHYLNAARHEVDTGQHASYLTTARHRTDHLGDTTGKTATALADTYPDGVSVWNVTGANGWPLNATGTLSMHKVDNLRAFQLLMDTHSTDYAPVLMRQTESSGGWGEWQRVVTADPETVDSAEIAGRETTASTLFTDLTTVGPTVTFTTRMTQRVAIHCSALVDNSVANNYAIMGVLVSGATSVAARQVAALSVGPAAEIASGFIFVTMNAGVSTVTSKYRAGGGTAGFADRGLYLMPVG